MIELIEEIIRRFGPRVAGSEAEKNAQLFIEEKCKELTDNVHFLPFQSYLDARFGKLKYYVALYFLALALYWLSAWAAAAVGLVNSFFLIADLMMYRNVLPNFPGKKQTSWNVEATLEPAGVVTNTILLSGHMDSTREYTWWYRWKATGIKLTVAAGVLMLLQAIFLSVVAVYPFAGSHYGWAIFLLLSPITIVYWSMHGKKGTPGAQDNLSGITIAYHIFQNFCRQGEKGKSTLQHTRLRFVSFGSEERGLCGSQAYAAKFKERLHTENARIINFDSIRLVEELAVVRLEWMNGTHHHPDLVNGIKKSFDECHLPCKLAVIPIGGTDATSFARIGIPSVTMVGMSTKEYDFTYHTRNDLVVHVAPKSLENARAGVAHFIRQWDEQQSHTAH